VRFHLLRHAAATLMLEANMNPGCPGDARARQHNADDAHLLRCSAQHDAASGEANGRGAELESFHRLCAADRADKTLAFDAQKGRRVDQMRRYGRDILLWLFGLD
jgi:hypothetical protein